MGTFKITGEGADIIVAPAVSKLGNRDVSLIGILKFSPAAFHPLIPDVLSDSPERSGDPVEFGARQPEGHRD